MNRLRARLKVLLTRFIRCLHAYVEGKLAKKTYSGATHRSFL